jgi:hypothetical protein
MPGTTTTAATDSASPGTDWTFILTAIGTAAAVIGAVALIVTLIYWLVKRPERAARADREAQLVEDVAELNTLVTAVAEEVRGRAPRPQLRFLVQGEPSPSRVVHMPAVPRLDVEAIVGAERNAALATIPRIILRLVWSAQELRRSLDKPRYSGDLLARGTRP